MAETKNERLVLGSGEIFYQEFTGTVPEDVKTLCTPDNRLALVSGGATLEYKPTFYTAKDDLGYRQKVIITEEEVLLKSGLCTFSGNVLAKLSPTARVSEDDAKKTRTTLIGGVGNRDGKSYLLIFRHKDPEDGDIYVVIVGTNEAGFSLSFQKDKESIIDAEFKAKPMDADGTLIKYIEELPGAAAVNEPTPKAK